LGGSGPLWPTEEVDIATLYEFDENVRFFTILGFFLHISPKKEHKGWLLKKCLK
jgi:hypothetical protein